jgi:hypothetical protein
MTNVERFIEAYSNDDTYFNPLDSMPAGLNAWVSISPDFKIIYYDTTQSLEDQEANMIHEMEHKGLLLGSEVIGTGGSHWDEERDTRRRTAEELVPLDDFKQAVMEQRFMDDYEAAAFYHISPKTLHDVETIYRDRYGVTPVLRWS